MNVALRFSEMPEDALAFHSFKEQNSFVFFLCSLYPSVCLENDFPVGPGIHLKGPKMTSRLSLNYKKSCFVYNDPSDGCAKEVDGILQVIVGIEPHLHELNSLPFLPMHLGGEGKTFRASCKKCVTD